MKTVNTQIAYILHKRAYRETSSILEVLTKNHGRVALMARGCRGVRSKIAGSLLPFTPLLISWQGKGGLPYLKSVERADLKAPVLKNKSLLSAMYINELLMYLLHKNDTHEAIFEHYHHCLYCLEDEKNLEISLRQFEITLLELLGFGLSVQTEADTGQPINAGAQYLYHLEHGPVLYHNVALKQSSGKQGQKKQNTGVIPQISGCCLLALANKSYQTVSDNPQYLAELKRLMRVVIQFHLGHKRLKSRELFRPVASIKPV